MKEDKKYIYFIQCGKFVKIGIADSVKRRLRQLQPANPENLSLIGVVIGDTIDELFLHQKFAEYNVRGEWFHLNNEIMEYINKHGMDSNPNGKEKI